MLSELKSRARWLIVGSLLAVGDRRGPCARGGDASGEEASAAAASDAAGESDGAALTEVESQPTVADHVSDFFKAGEVKFHLRLRAELVGQDGLARQRPTHRDCGWAIKRGRGRASRVSSSSKTSVRPTTTCTTQPGSTARTLGPS